MNPKLRRARRLRSSRGAAMVEGVVVIPFFILMFAGATFVGGFYVNRIETQSRARLETWTRAVSQSCDDGATGTLAGLEIVDSQDLGELATAPLAALCEADFGSLTYTARASYAVTGAFGFEKNIAATGTSVCNESPIAGDAAYAAAVEFLWEAFQNQGRLPENTQERSGVDWPAFFPANADAYDP